MTVAIEDQIDFAEPVEESFEKQWDGEWKKQLLEVALRRVRSKVKLRHYMIFEMAVLRNAPVAEIKKTLGVGLALIYVPKHHSAQNDRLDGNRHSPNSRAKYGVRTGVFTARKSARRRDQEWCRGHLLLTKLRSEIRELGLDWE